ncbi:MAG TPA: malate synthase A [Amycolatopsis sp.]|nr:malate synthase A [Amycolatopsis sp.]
MSHAVPGTRLRVAGPLEERFAEILTPDALEFVARLDNAFAGRRREVLDARRERREKLASGEQTLDFLPRTRWIRGDPSWHVAPPAPDLEDRRVEITGPADRESALAALDSGARVWTADLEDATAPAWSTMIGAQLTLSDAVRRTLDRATEDGKRRTIGDHPAAIVVRPRGWHLVEKHLLIDGRPVSASLVDFGLYFFHNARRLARGSGPYFCLPKLESHLEARLWNDVFLLAQRELGIPRGTVRATVPIETITAAFEMEEILYELREHASGLAVGRSDYLFSIIKTLGTLGADYVLPDRDQVTMTAPFLRAYTELLVSTCHKRGAHAIGGVTAFLPGTDFEHTTAAVEQVRRNAEREAAEGFDGSPVAHPDLVAVCEEVFDGTLGGWPNQLGRPPEDVAVPAGDLLNVASAGGEVTEEGVRADIAVAVRYVDAWLRGTGAVAIGHSRESAATAELARCQVWQWIHHGTKLADGTTITAELVRGLLDEELAGIRAERRRQGGNGGRLDDARAIFEETALGEALPGFLTTGAYARYLTST